MIGRTSRAVAMKYAKPTTPKTPNTAKDTFSTVSTVMPSLGSWGCVFIFQTSKSTPAPIFKAHSNPPAISASKDGKLRQSTPGELMIEEAR
jgi:hypothetical protein